MMTGLEFVNRDGERIDHTFHPGSRVDVLLILGHGVTGHKDRPLLVALAEGLSAAGWPCLRISYSGNGGSEGQFVESCITKEIGDLQSVMDAVPRGVPIYYLGHSMGGAVGVLTAARDARIHALVSLAGMTHTADFVQREFGDVVPDQGFMWEDSAHPLSSTYVRDLQQIGDTLSAVEAVTQPWLLIHGEADDVIPIQDGRDAYDAATCKKEFVAIPGAGHTLEEAGYTVLVTVIDRFLQGVDPGISVSVTGDA